MNLRQRLILEIEAYLNCDTGNIFLVCATYHQGSHLHRKTEKMKEVFPVREKSGNLNILPESKGKVKRILGESGEITSGNKNIFCVKIIKKVVVSVHIFHQ